jgi:[ribosomal protein S18]-alanine N-acetyltransferase
VTLRLARAEDISSLETLEHECFGHAPTVADELSRTWAQVTVSEDATHTLMAYLVAWRIADEIEIIQVATATEARRNGHGRALMRHVLEHSRANGAVRCVLEVRPSNTSALGLYHSLGFVEVSRRRGYYNNGEDALVMSLQL